MAKCLSKALKGNIECTESMILKILLWTSSRKHYLFHIARWPKNIIIITFLNNTKASTASSPRSRSPCCEWIVPHFEEFLLIILWPDPKAAALNIPFKYRNYFQETAGSELWPICIITSIPFKLFWRYILTQHLFLSRSITIWKGVVLVLHTELMLNQRESLSKTHKIVARPIRSSKLFPCHSEIALCSMFY